VLFSHNAQRHKQTDGRTDRRIDDSIVPIADHTACAARAAKNPHAAKEKEPAAIGQVYMRTGVQ